MFDVLLINYHCLGQVRNLVRLFESMPLIGRVIVLNNSRGDLDDWGSFGPTSKMVCASALRNTGYAGGNQLAFEIQQGLPGDHHLCVLNADVSVQEGVFDAGMDVFTRDPGIGQIHFRTVDENHEFVYDALKLRGLLHAKRTRGHGQIVASDYAAGSFFLMRNEALADLDCLFFEPYFLYWEEVDLSFRLRRAGWKSVCYTECQVVRESNPPQTEIRSIYYIVRNAFLFEQRNQPERPQWASFIVKYLLRSTRLALTNRSALPLANYFAGLYDGFRGKTGER